jgi:hypothetical protein
MFEINMFEKSKFEFEKVQMKDQNGKDNILSSK